MTKTFDPKDIAPAEFYKLITNTVTPRPIAFVSSCDKNGNVNLSPFSFFNVFSANPPILVFSPLRRMRNNTIKDTLDNVKENAEVVINLVSYDFIEQMSLASCEYEKGVNEFIKAGLTEQKSQKVKPPCVKEAKVSFECIVKQTVSLGENGGAGTLVICEVILAHINESILNEKGNPDPLKLDIVARLGGDWYSKLNEETVFKITKPSSKLGVGVDNIPLPFRQSEILSGNDLGKLGSIETTPAEEEVAAYVEKNLDLKVKTKEELHQIVKSKLAEDKITEAWLIILSSAQ